MKTLNSFKLRDKRGNAIVFFYLFLLLLLSTIILWNCMVQSSKKNTEEYKNDIKKHQRIYKLMVSDSYDAKKCYESLNGILKFLGYENGSVVVSVEISNNSDSYVCVPYSKLFSTQYAFTMTDTNDHIIPSLSEYEEKKSTLA